MNFKVICQSTKEREQETIELINKIDFLERVIEGDV